MTAKSRLTVGFLNAVSAKDGEPKFFRVESQPGSAAALSGEGSLSMKKAPVREGETVEVDIAGFGSFAEGTGRLGSFTVFVPGALPDETVRAKIVSVKKNYARARLISLISKSPKRVAPPFPLFERCGGCQSQHMSYEAELMMKRGIVEEALRRIGGLHDVPVHQVSGMDEPWRYRNKMQFPVGSGEGVVISGCFARGSHDIVDTEDCLIQREENNLILKATREAMKRLGIPPYDEDRHTGSVRHIMGRVGAGGHSMAVIVTRSERLAYERELIKAIRAGVPGICSIQQNIQTYRNNVIMGRDTRLLWGEPFIREKIGTLTFRISPRSFFQVNTVQAGTLYRKVLKYAAPDGGETIVDAYSGTGTITLFLAKRARLAYGIEIVPEAVSDAVWNARKNGIRNVRFLNGDASKLMPRLLREGTRADAVILDPPRAGCSPDVLEAAASMRPDRIVYVSCNPATLSRDLALLTGLGYRAAEVCPIDMFPKTSNVESVALMTRDS